jgi:hypothetical protein
VYHSSPHDFDKFDLSKLRTGEGANTYGSGFYFAENPAVSGQDGQYWKQFYNRFPVEEMDTAELLRQHGFQRDPAIATVQGHIDALKKSVSEVEKRGGANLEFYQRMLAARERERDVLASGAPVGPRTYEVNIKAKPEELLDWDKPLSAQPNIRDALERETSHLYHARRTGFPDPTGEEFIKKIAGDHAGVSQELNAIGIPGIRYLDQGSRGARDAKIASIKMTGDGYLVPGGKQFATYDEAKAALGITPPSHNYVAFDPSKLDIMAKYGIAGAPAGLALGSAFDQSAYAAQPDTFDQRWGQQ